MSKLVVSVIGLLLALLLVRADPALADRRVALVIGNSAYQNVPTLADPQRDAHAVAATLQKAGFDVVNAQYDVGNLQFKRAVAQFEDEARRSDIALIYYSGYALDIAGVNYLIPVDAKQLSEATAGGEAVTLGEFAKAVEPAKRLRLVILDASRSSPFARIATPQRSGAAPEYAQGLGEPAPKPGTLIAYAAIAGSLAKDGDGEHSIFTAAVLHHLFVPGLDIRLAFGRVLVEVLRKTDNQQNPLVYGSLGGRNIALLPAPAERPGMDLAGEKTDYSVVEQIGSPRAWEVFLVQHPTGFFSTDARMHLRLAEAEPSKPAALASPSSLPPLSAGPSAEELQAWAHIESSNDPDQFRGFIHDYPGSALAEKARQRLDQLAALEQTPPQSPPPAENTSPQLPPAENTPAMVTRAQQALIRLGCFTGTADGVLDESTKRAIGRYESARRQKTNDNISVTDGLLADLQQQQGRVCPLLCPAGQIARGEQCIETAKPSPPVAHREIERPRTARQSRPSQETRAALPQRASPQTGGGGGHSGVTIGVGF